MNNPNTFQQLSQSLESSSHPLIYLGLKKLRGEEVSGQQLIEELKKFGLDGIQDEDKIIEGWKKLDLISPFLENEDFKNRFLAYLFKEVIELEERIIPVSDRRIKDHFYDLNSINVEILSLQSLANLKYHGEAFPKLISEIVIVFVGFILKLLSGEKENYNISENENINVILNYKLIILESSFPIILDLYREKNMIDSQESAARRIFDYYSETLRKQDFQFNLLGEYWLLGKGIRVSKETSDKYVSILLKLLSKYLPAPQVSTPDTASNNSQEIVFNTKELSLFIHYLQNLNIVQKQDLKPTAISFSKLTGRSWDTLRKYLSPYEIETSEIQGKGEIRPSGSLVKVKSIIEQLLQHVNDRIESIK